MVQEEPASFSQAATQNAYTEGKGPLRLLWNHWKWNGDRSVSTPSGTDLEKVAQPAIQESRYAVGEVSAFKETLCPPSCQGSALLLRSESMTQRNRMP